MKKVNKTLYAIITLLFGSLGINKFYTGRIKQGIITLLFSWTFIPTILSLVEFVTILTIKADKDKKIDVSSDKIKNVKLYAFMILFTLFIVGSVIPWNSIIPKFDLFTEINESMFSMQTSKQPLIVRILGTAVSTGVSGETSGSIPSFGNYSLLNISILLFAISLIISLLAGKINDGIKNINSGIKKAFPISVAALTVTLVFIITMINNNQGGVGIGVTILNGILSIAKSFNLFLALVATLIGSIISPISMYFYNLVSPIFTIVYTNSNVYSVIGFILQSVYYLVMIFAPTSIALVIGLYYFDIPYNKWFKFIWKVLLSIFIIIIIISIILTAII